MQNYSGHMNQITHGLPFYVDPSDTLIFAGERYTCVLIDRTPLCEVESDVIVTRHATLSSLLLDDPNTGRSHTRPMRSRRNAGAAWGASGVLYIPSCALRGAKKSRPFCP